MSDLETYLKSNDARIHDELFAFLRIPSVSSLPEHKADVRQAAEWVAGKLRSIGVPTVEIMPGCYDALSAKLVADAGYKVTFMSGFAVSAARRRTSRTS